MADSQTINLSPAHPPKPASIEAFQSCLDDIKSTFHKTRRDWDLHQPEMFSKVNWRSDHELLNGLDLTTDLTEVRTAETAYPPLHQPVGVCWANSLRYGLHILGKIKLCKTDDAFIHVRIFVTEEVARVHGIQTKEHIDLKGHKTFNAIFTGNDPLEWFSQAE